MSSARREHRKITCTINNLLDNLTAVNRDPVDQRLTGLKSRLRRRSSAFRVLFGLDGALHGAGPAGRRRVVPPLRRRAPMGALFCF